MEFRKMVMMTLYARQQKRHRYIEQSFGFCGEGKGGMIWENSIEMYITICEIDDQSKFDAWRSDQIRSVAQSCLTLCDPMNRSTPGLPVHHQLPEFTETHGHRVSDAIQPSHPLSSPSPPAHNPSQPQSLFQWVSSSHEVAKVLEFQL